MTRPASDEDSDSAPEDIAFQDAKNDALEQIKTVSEAAKQKKKIRKEANKRKLEVLAEQKQKKLKKIKDLESKKLPEFFLDTLDDEAPVPEKKVVNVGKRENTKITFDEDLDSDGETEDFIALETDATDFKVVTRKDLNSSKFKSSEAYNFREKMLFGSRVKREPFKKQSLQREKLKAGGKVGKDALRKQG